MAFGFDQLTTETPTWAKWMFRVTFLITTLIASWIVTTGLIDVTIKVEIMGALKLLDGFIFGLSKFFGIELKPPEKI